MVEKFKIVSFAELKDGMKVAKDFEENNQTILKKDTIITEGIISKLKSVYIFGTIEIYNPDYIEVTQVDTDLKKKEEYNKIEKKLNNISLILQTTFKDICGEDKNSMDNIRIFSKAIQEEIKPGGNIIKNVVLHGSGEDPTYRHGVNVAILSALLGTWLEFDAEKLNLLVYSAMLHDLGKSKIDQALLDKNKRLSKEEFNIVKSHTSIGYKYMKNISGIDQSVIYGVLMHHERDDGSGYPLGLKSDSIHPFGKIIAIADVFDAINSNRGYKDKKLPFEALQIVQTEGLGRLDYEYVKVFISHMINYYSGEEVLLNTGERCKIVQMNANDLERPLVLKNDEFIDLEKERDLYIKEILL